MDIMPPEPDQKTDTLRTSSLRHAYCTCQWTGPTYVAMCGHAQSDEPRWVNNIPPDACLVCLDLLWSRCPYCGAEAA